MKVLPRRGLAYLGGQRLGGHVFARLSLVLLAVFAGAVLFGCQGPGQFPEGPLGRVPENDVVAGEPVVSGVANTMSVEAVFNVGRPRPSLTGWSWCHRATSGSSAPT